MPPKKGGSAGGGGNVSSTPAAKPQLAYMDDSRLRPIHTAIDAGQHKPAMKLLQAALQKHGQQHVLIALVALVHAQLGETAEARKVLRTLPALSDVDLRTVHTLLLVNRTMEDIPSLIRCYECAISHASGQQVEDLQVQLFFVLARTGDFAKLQTAGMKLFTSFKKDKYLVWSALNLLMLRRDKAQQTAALLPAGAAAASNTAAASSSPATAATASASATTPAAAAAPAPASDKLLQLLSMMLSRTFSAPKYPRSMTPEELLVLFRILRKQNKFADCITLLDSEAGHNFKDKDATEYMRIRALLLREASEFEEDDSSKCAELLAQSNGVYEALCRQHPDDWFFLTQIIAGEFTLARKQQQQQKKTDAAASSSPATPEADATAAAAATVPPLMSFDARVDRLRQFVRELQVACTHQGTGVAFKRGPFLAEVEIECQLLSGGPSSSTPATTAAAALVPQAGNASGLEESLLSYFRHFGHKTCFFFDVLTYWNMLDGHTRARIAQNCTNAIPAIVGEQGGHPKRTEQEGQQDKSGGASNAEAAQVKRFQLSLTVQQLLRFNSSCSPSQPALNSSSSSTTTDLRSVGQSLFEQFMASSTLPSSLTRIASERGVGDHFALLFASAYLTHFTQGAQGQGQGGQGGDRAVLVDVILGLELALSKFSPHNFQLKLWLVRLYSHPSIGGLHRAAQLVRSLDLKQVQLDITAHLLLDDALRYGHVIDEAGPLCRRVTNWHASADREDVATTELGYSRANYSKVMEFVEFKERRQKSTQRYTAALVGAHADIVKLGAQTTTQGGAAAAPVSAADAAANTKDIVNVHALLKRVREDLSTKWPLIVDHSSNAPLEYLVANNDYTVITTWDAHTAPLATLLNRPAPALYASSFALPLDELLRPRNDDTHTHHPSTAHLHQLRFFRLSIELLWAMLEQNAPALRKHMPDMQQVLVDMKLLDVSAVTAPTEALATFDAQHWRMCLLIFDCSACVVESAAYTSAHLNASVAAAGAAASSAESDADKVAELTLRWHSVQRQMTIIASLIDSLTKDLAERFFIAPASGSMSAEARAVVHGEAADAGASTAYSLRGADPRALRDAAALAQYGSMWLTLAEQVWATGVPTKKTFQKRNKKAAAAAASANVATPSVDDGAAVDSLQECVLSVRMSLASLIKAHRASLASMQSLCKRLAKRAKEVPAALQIASVVAAPAAAANTESADASALSTSSLLEHKPSLRALQAPEHAQLVQAVLQHLDSSHGHTGAQLLQMYAAIDQPLQHVKL